MPSMVLVLRPTPMTLPLWTSIRSSSLEEISRWLPSHPATLTATPDIHVKSSDGAAQVNRRSRLFLIRLWMSISNRSSERRVWAEANQRDHRNPKENCIVLCLQICIAPLAEHTNRHRLNRNEGCRSIHSSFSLSNQTAADFKTRFAQWLSVGSPEVSALLAVNRPIECSRQLSVFS